MREDQLLQRFTAKGSDAAFAELVRRNLDFVYGVCRRKVGDRELAQDITQSVFLLLAAKAGSLKPGTVLSGWLFQTAHLACQNALRTEARRRHYERKAVQEMEVSARSAPELWGQVEPVLDDALAHLSAADRDAVLLRYVEELSPEEMAVALGISAAAAQKRVSRALERLRRGLAHAGTALTLTTLSVLLSEKMVQATPLATADNIFAAVSSVGGSAAFPAPAHAPPGQTHWAHFGRPAMLSKTQGTLAALTLGVAAGIGILVFVKAAQTHPKPILQVGSVAQRTTILRGSVVNTDGSVAANVGVTVLSYAMPGGAASRFADVRTDNTGRYSASGPYSEGDHWMVVADSGTQIGFGTPGAPCVLLPPTRLRLHFVGPNGLPMSNLRVHPLLLSRADRWGQPESVNFALGCPPRLVANTDGAGNAVFDGLPQGWVATFAVLDPQYQRRPPSADGLPLTHGADSGDYTVAVAFGASVQGRLLYAETGLPAAGVRVGAQETQTSAWGEAETDSTGRYQITQLTAGRYTVAVDEQSLVLGSEWTADAVPNVVLRPGQAVIGQEINLVRGQLITGKVTRLRDHRPVVGTEIGAYGPAHPATGAWVGGGWTQADGTYQIRVPPGRQHVYPMVVPGGGGGTDVMVRDGQNAVVNFALP